MWLRDRLPKEIPFARSIIYGYDTALVGSESVKGIEDIAVAFITKMTSIGGSSLSAKPVVILAHSLGGIVLKQAMVLMARTGGSSHSMLNLIQRAVFFGVPNAGMEISHILPMVDSQPTAPIVHSLSTSSDYLRGLDAQFYGIASHRRIDICSVYETKMSPTTQVLLLISLAISSETSLTAASANTFGGMAERWSSGFVSGQNLCHST